jgi:hypothetical protein
MRGVWALLILICFSVLSFAQSQRPQPKSPQQQPAAQQQSAPDQQRGTERAPFIVEIQQPEQAQKVSPTNTEHKPERSDNWFSGWNLTDRIAAVATAAAFLQFVALVVTIGVQIGTSRRQLRAYVFPDASGVYEGMMLDTQLPAHENDVGVALALKNTGQTPAFDVLTWTKITITVPAEEDKLVPPRLEEKFPAYIGANSVMPKFLWLGRALSAAEIADINNQVRAIYLYGRIEYRDAFNRYRYSNFRLRYNGPFPPPKGVSFLYCEKGNSAN